ncbi:DUF4236 domain-containing protein [Streptomyces bathyalis]|uniref:DUF4236 domain-containing protein n=1 Tax=Streptomyces bathyalis TaxID=2710756 RepID=A0A7T1WSE3_9ACTN|nr:DUF4236 domain-containing protein [Streptomyces bathyalis]QPP05650.1 DUF4236 domain-containing protein [Streptomyces bathyalis]
MPLTFRKSFRVLPGVKVNINRKSWSVTTGGKHGPRRTVSSDGRRTTSMDLPGPFGYRHTTSSSSSRRTSRGSKLKTLTRALRGGKH